MPQQGLAWNGIAAYSTPSGGVAYDTTHGAAMQGDDSEEALPSSRTDDGSAQHPASSTSASASPALNGQAVAHV